MVKIGSLSNLTAEYSLTETLSLTNSSWNYFGFANLYDVSFDITQYTGATAGLEVDDSIYLPTFSLVVKPSECEIHKITEQRVSTILSGLASAGGIFSVIIAIQAFLFGFRPNSPWGIVQRWSYGRPRRSLREQLRGKFTTNNIPMLLKWTPLNQGEDSQNVVLKVGKMEDRMQLMEDLFKTYYIDDEIFQKLNEARKNNTGSNDEKQEKASFTRLNQEDEETSINQTGEYKDSRFLS